MDLLKLEREHQKAFANYSPELRGMITKLAQEDANAKLIVQTPGTESKFNGHKPTAADLMVKIDESDFVPGHEFTKNELTELGGGNPKSGKDKGHIDKLLPQMAARIDVQPGKRSKIVLRIGHTIEDDTPLEATDDKKKK